MKKKIAVLMVSLLLGMSTLTLNIQLVKADPGCVYVTALFKDNNPVEEVHVVVRNETHEYFFPLTNASGQTKKCGVIPPGSYMAEAYYPDTETLFSTGVIIVDEFGNGSRTLTGSYEITPPVIEILSPQNMSHTNTTSVPLNFTVYDYASISWTGYSLDGQANMTLTGNTTLSGLSYGYHNLAVYANDTYGNMGASGKILFAVSHLVPDDYPTIQEAIVSSNGYDETELLTDQEIYQDYVSPTHRWYLHNMVNSNYTAFFNITEHTPAISVQALGHEDVNQLGIGLFHDVNHDNEPQLLEYVGYMDAKEQNVHVFLVNPPLGQYIIKVLGWEVLGEPGHFDLQITTYTGYGIVFLSSRNNIITENLVKHNPVGLYLHDSYNTTIQLNDAIENVGGIVLSDSRECVISNNNAILNEFGSGIRQFGIGMTFWSVHDFYISENNVSSNTFGVWLFNSSDNEIIGNGLVSNLGWGLVLYASYDNFL